MAQVWEGGLKKVMVNLGLKGHKRMMRCTNRVNTRSCPRAQKEAAMRWR